MRRPVDVIDGCIATIDPQFLFACEFNEVSKIEETGCGIHVVGEGLRFAAILAKLCGWKDAENIWHLLPRLSPESRGEFSCRDG